MPTNDKPAVPPVARPWWLLYLTLLAAGVILLADAYQLAHLHRWTAKLGIGLIYSAFVLFVGRGRPLSVVSAVIMGLTIIATFIT